MVGDHLGPSGAAVDAGRPSPTAVPSVRIGNLVLNAPLYQPRAAGPRTGHGGRRQRRAPRNRFGQWVYRAADFAGFRTAVPVGRTTRRGAGRTPQNDPHACCRARTTRPAPVQAPPPILVAGIGDKMLIVGRRIRRHHRHRGARAQRSNRRAHRLHQEPGRVAVSTRSSSRSASFRSPSTSTPDLTLLRSTSPTSTDEELMQSVTLLQGSISEAAERIVSLAGRVRDQLFHAQLVARDHLGPVRKTSRGCPIAANGSPSAVRVWWLAAAQRVRAIR